MSALLVSLGCLLAVVLLARNARASLTPTAVYGPGPRSLFVASASPGELGLLAVLGEAYGARAGCAVAWLKAGSGRAFELLRQGDADVVMVHAPAAVRQAVAEGWAGHDALIGSNEFYLVGPAADPAGVATAGDIVEAYRKIAAAQARFFSRGDDSGTHKKEMAIWQEAGIAPAGDWYVVTGDFMTATLRRAESEGGYFMTDSSVWEAEKARLPGLTRLFSGDARLVNTYHALCRMADGTPESDLAAGFIDFVASPEGQALLLDFGRERFGASLYHDAAYARQYESDGAGAEPA